MQIRLPEDLRTTPLGREGEAILEPCVQCGQCTPVCPTFRLLDDEWDGPRGRIFLIKQLLEGEAPRADLLTPAYTLQTLTEKTLAGNVRQRLDRCLTCRSCEAACPQGVRYGRLLDIGRELVEKVEARSLPERALRWSIRTAVSKRRRFDLLLRAGRSLRPLLPNEWRARIPEKRQAGRWPLRAHTRRMLIWQGCVQPALAPDVNAAAARVLDRFGIRLDPVRADCCGALSQHMGATEEARAILRRTVDALWPQVESGVEAIVLTASGCGAFLREYAQLLADDPDYRDKAWRISELVKDIAEVVTEEWRDAPATAAAGKSARRVAFQSSCSLQHSQRLNGVVEKLLRRAGFKLLPVTYPFMCCGAAGSYSILQAKLAKSLRARKLETLLERRPQVIATANIGCLTHLAGEAPVPVRHWIELFDEALAELPQPVSVAQAVDNSSPLTVATT